MLRLIKVEGCVVVAGSEIEVVKLGKRVVGVELLMWAVVDGQVGRGEVVRGLSLGRICRWRN